MVASARPAVSTACFCLRCTRNLDNCAVLIMDRAPKCRSGATGREVDPPRMVDFRLTGSLPGGLVGEDDQGDNGTGLDNPDLLRKHPNVMENLSW